MKRYFIVFYQCQAITGVCKGDEIIITEDNKYLNANVTIDTIYHNVVNHYGIIKNTIIITNIIEITVGEYTEYIR